MDSATFIFITRVSTGELIKVRLNIKHYFVGLQPTVGEDKTKQLETFHTAGPSDSQHHLAGGESSGPEESEVESYGGHPTWVCVQGGNKDYVSQMQYLRPNLTRQNSMVPILSKLDSRLMGTPNSECFSKTYSLAKRIQNRN